MLGIVENIKSEGKQQTIKFTTVAFDKTLAPAGASVLTKLFQSTTGFA